MTNKKPTKKQTTAKPQPKKPVVKKPVAAQTSKPETVKIRIETHEAGHVHAGAAVATTIGGSSTPKKKSLWRKIFGFGF